MKHTAYLGLGSNLGDRFVAIRSAIDALVAHCEITFDHSRDPASVFESPAIDAPEGSPPFLNTVIRVTTDLSPEGLFEFCRRVESELGRVRTVRNAPRTIDIDLLLFDDHVLERPGLILPHPRLHERLFVLEPLAELAPNLMHPVLDLTITDLLSRARKLYDDQSVTRLRATTMLPNLKSATF